jgi:FHA domain-containing protein
MKITVRAVALNEQSITQPITAVFTAAGGSIGRADNNQLPLPDPERRISRRQAEIGVDGKSFVIRNVGSANPIIVREQSLAQGESAPLRSGDQVRIGGYLLEVSSDGDVDDRTEVDRDTMRQRDPSAAAAPAFHAEPAREAPRLPRTPSFADIGLDVSARNPFADLLGNEVAPASSPAASDATPAPSRLPDDFDPFAEPPPAPVARLGALPASGGGAFDDLVPTAERASIDEMFGLTTSTTSGDPLAAFMAGAAAPAAPAATTDHAPPASDPLAMFANARQPVAPDAPSVPDHTPELRAGFAPPKPVPPATRVPPPAQVRPPTATPPTPAVAVAKIEPRPASHLAARAAAAQSAPQAAAAPHPVASASQRDDESTNPPATAGWSEESLAVWHYLCEGAGVRLDPPPNTGPAFMRVVGMMLRAAVEGTVQQMAIRQATRQELQAQVTVIRPKNNNPLKFAPDGQSAMEQMLQPAVRGFLPGPAAMTDAMHDLLGHAIGTMAGTRAALEGVLKRFGPQELEAKLASHSVLDSVLPMNRKAKLWELYLQHYGSIRDEAQEDFHTLFGRAFLAAYEQQLERLRREKASTSAAPK